MKQSHLFIAAVVACMFCIEAHAQVLIKDKTVKPPTALIKKEKALHFIAMGDWGRNGDDHQKQVARQMGKTARDLHTQFVISTGDNFYPSGVISEHDPLFRYSFEEIYTDFSLQWDWYPVLGNHDYKSNPDAQVAYTNISRRWKMPARYFSKKFSLGDSTKQVLIVFIDTNPLIPAFYSNSEYGPNVRTQDSAKQKQWLDEVLSDPSPNIKWKIVVGHHPMYSAGGRVENYDTKAIRNSLLGVMEKNKVDIFLTGHEHSLQHLFANGIHHFISGAASEKTPVAMTGICQMAASTYGFMTFSVTATEILVQTIDDTGKVIYASTVRKSVSQEEVKR